jgi:hypothetical protein
MTDTQDVERKPLYDLRDGLGRRRTLLREGFDPDQEVEVRAVHQQKQLSKQ